MSRISSLKVSSLKYAYNHNNLILNGIDLNIFEGEILSILGPSGCGKTTFKTNFWFREVISRANKNL